MTLPAWLITGNGTRVHDRQGNLIFARDLPSAVAEEVIHRRWDTPATLHVFNDQGGLPITHSLNCWWPIRSADLAISCAILKGCPRIR